MTTPSAFQGCTECVALRLNYNGKNTTVVERVRFLIDDVSPSYVIAHNPNNESYKIKFVTPTDPSNLYLDCYKDPYCGLKNEETHYVLFNDVHDSRRFESRLELVEEIKKHFRDIHRLSDGELEAIFSDLV